MHLPVLNIVGAGKVGKVLGCLFARAQVFQIGQICNRSLDSALAAAGFIDAGEAITDLADFTLADLIMLSVPDDEIAVTCAALVLAGKIKPGAIVFHCSGAKSSQLLDEARQAGASVASLHPVASFADSADLVRHFDGTICGLEGDPPAVASLQQALEKIGAQILAIRSEHKLLYHAGSVFASNYLVTLIDIALRAYQAAGIPADMARQLAAPLARQSLENIFKTDPASALTGPIARGDMQTVATQSAALHNWNHDAAQVYDSMIAPTSALAARKRGQA
jgi:predicted short-subunit dehydrogenase-like oxidoreductase (DUF2520 family)